MQIELMGCTSAGKSTLAGGILQACREEGNDLVMGYDFVLEQVHLNWMKGRLSRSLALDLISFFACLVSLRKNRHLYLFAIRLMRRPGIPRLEKLNLLRNVFKKVGVYETIRRRKPEHQIVLLDEGTLHAAHNLFVHVSAVMTDSELSDFVRFVPLPDVVVYVRQRESVLIQRTMKRGHKRIPDPSLSNVELFIKRAITTFDKLAQNDVIESKLLVVDNDLNLNNAQDLQADPARSVASRLVRSGIDVVKGNRGKRGNSEPHPDPTNIYESANSGGGSKT